MRASTPGFVIALALVMPAFAAHAQSPPVPPRAGDAYEITREIVSAWNDNRGSTGSSSDRDTLVERVVAVRADGIELEYALPEQSSPQDRARNWQFPARILQPSSGPLRLVNAAELKERVDRWLAAGRMTRAACGKWIFTWNAFRIECDPQTVLETVRAFSFGFAVMREGVLYDRPGTLAPVRWKRRPAKAGGATFVAEMRANPKAVIRDHAEADVVAAGLSGKTLPLANALRARSSERVSGSVTVMVDTDAAGSVLRRTSVTMFEVKKADGIIENRRTTETVKRRRVSRRPPADA